MVASAMPTRSFTGLPHKVADDLTDFVRGKIPKALTLEGGPSSTGDPIINATLDYEHGQSERPLVARVIDNGQPHFIFHTCQIRFKGELLCEVCLALVPVC